MRGDVQRTVNDALWRSGRYVHVYDSADLYPPEAAIFARERARLAGRVLELGCGAGRVTGHLVALGGEVHGMDLAPAMVERARERHPAANFHVGDLRDLRLFAGEPWNAVLAMFGVLDVLDDAGRRAELEQVRGLLRDGGLFVFSSHNRGAAHRRKMPTDVRWRQPLHAAVDLARLPRRQFHHRRAARGEREEEDHAILNDVSHDFRALHYYVTRDVQERQLEAAGFALESVFGRDG